MQGGHVLAATAVALAAAGFSSGCASSGHSTSTAAALDALPPAPVCPARIVTSADHAPARADLHGAFGGQDILSPVHDQEGRADCWAFAEVSQLETEYVGAYARAHDEDAVASFRADMNLSPQYLIDLYYLNLSEPLFADGFWYTTPASDPSSGGMYTSVNLAALTPTCGGPPLFALPRLADWPTPRSSAAILQPMMQAVPMTSPSGTRLFAPDDVYDFSLMLSIPPSPPSGRSEPGAFLLDMAQNGVPYGLDLDLANFGWSQAPAVETPRRSVYPPPIVHEDARYAPLRFVSIAAYQANAPIAQELPSACDRRRIWDYPVVTPTSLPSAAQKACYHAIAAPFERVLSEGHPIVFGTDVDAWSYHAYALDIFDPPMDARSYWTGGSDRSTTELVDCSRSQSSSSDDCAGPFPLAQSGDHTLLLIGYDAERQLFHVKNSWGTGWGTGQGTTGTPDGTAWMTYDLFLRTVIAPTYIDGVWDPTGALATSDPVPAPVPNGAWFGFWRGALMGATGVAVIGHFPFDDSLYDPSTGVFHGQPGQPVGTFYPAGGGSTTSFQLTAWGTRATEYWAEFSDMGSPARPLFRLTKTFGSALPVASYVDAATSSDDPAVWSKCSSGGAWNVSPRTYAETENDPYVFPPCDGKKWHVEPTWRCPRGGEYVAEVEYTEGAIPEAGAEAEVTRLCLLESGAPVCDENVLRDASRVVLLREDVDAVQMNFAVEPDQFGEVEQGGAAMPAWVDACVPRADPRCASRGDCAWPTCPAAARASPGTKQPLLGANPWVRVRKGADACVSSTYAPTPSCPGGYILSPNGDDCLAR